MKLEIISSFVFPFQISQGIKKIAKQGIQGNFEIEDAMIGTQSTNSKQFIRLFINSGNDSAQVHLFFFNTEISELQKINIYVLKKQYKSRSCISPA